MDSSIKLQLNKNKIIKDAPSFIRQRQYQSTCISEIEIIKYIVK
jgi:hypothetical protein